MLQAGDCYLIPTNTDSRGYEVLHLHVILLDGEQYTQNTIVVPICTFDSPRQDQTVLLKTGEHEFIVKDSYVYYKRAKIRSIQDIQRNIDERIAKPKDRIDITILERILAGVMKSSHTPIEVKEMYNRYVFRKLEK